MLLLLCFALVSAYGVYRIADDSTTNSALQTTLVVAPSVFAALLGGLLGALAGSGFVAAATFCLVGGLLGGIVARLRR